VLDWQYEDLAECEAIWADWWALPTTAEFMRRWGELAEPDFVSEIWNQRSAADRWVRQF
jgi:hypothetical protein